MQEVFGLPSTCLVTISFVTCPCPRYLKSIIYYYSIICNLLEATFSVTCKCSYYLSPLVCAPPYISVLYNCVLPQVVSFRN